MQYLIDGVGHRQKIRSLTLIVALAAVALTLASLARPFSAHALIPDPDFWKQTAERQDTVNRLIYAESPQSIPSSYSAMREAEEILRAREQALPPANPQTPGIWQQLRTVTVRSSLSTPMRALGTVGLAVGTFEVGWKIGSGINAKFLHIGIPEATDPTVDYRWTEIRWADALSQTFAGAEWPAADGWLISMRQTCCSFDATNRWFDAPCPFSGFTPPAPFVVGGPVATTTQCYGTGVPPGYADASVRYGWASEDALTAAGPIEDYDSQSHTKASPAPTPDSQSTVEDAIEDELAQPENELLLQWLNYNLGSPGESDQPPRQKTASLGANGPTERSSIGTLRRERS